MGEFDLCFAVEQCRRFTTGLSSMCPCLLINASLDVGLLPHAQDFASILRDASVSVEGPIALPNTDHFSMMVRVGRSNPSDSDNKLLALIETFVWQCCNDAVSC